MEYTVSKTDAGMKLVQFLKRMIGEELSSREIKRLIESNQCQLNHRIEKFASTIVKEGDIISFSFDAIEKNTFQDIEILYEDPYILAIDKPSGISSDDSVLQKAPYLLHRLDKGTTGVLLFAKTKEAKALMESLFKDRKIQKIYLAIVDGIPKKKSGTLHASILKVEENRWAVDSRGKEAMTQWTLLQKGQHTALVECRPITGRTHQIRLHLKYLGNPIIGDTHYTSRFNCKDIPCRFLLHASSVSFIHPFTQSQITIRSELPLDFVDFIYKNNIKHFI